MILNNNDSILKFDTEGAEWDILPDINTEILKNFRIIVCELHWITSVADKNFRKIISKTLEVLTKNHTVVHLHANNCCGMQVIEGVAIPAVVEVTLLRNDRSKFLPSTEAIPGPLDFPNLSDRVELILNPYV